MKKKILSWVIVGVLCMYTPVTCLGSVVNVTEVEAVDTAADEESVSDNTAETQEEVLPEESTDSSEDVKVTEETEIPEQENAESSVPENTETPEENTEATEQELPVEEEEKQLEADVEDVENDGAGISVSGSVITISCSSGETISGVLDEALEQARDLATDENPITVKVPAGTYKIASNMHIYSNTTLDLQGVTLKADGSGSFNMIMSGTSGSYMGESNYNNSSLCAGYGGFKNITIKGGTFVGKKSNTGTIIRIAHATNVTLDGVTLSGGGCAHQIEVAAIDGFYVKNCTFKDFGESKTDDPDKQEALQLDIPCASDVFKNVYLDGTVMKNVEITGCTFSNVPRGVGSHTSLHGAYHTNIKINNNTFKNVTEEAIIGLNYNNCEIKNNKITDCGAGVLFQYFKANTASVYTTTFDGAKKYSGEVLHDAKTVITGNNIQTKYYSTCDEIQGIKIYGYILSGSKKGGDGKKIEAGDYYISGVTVENNTIVTAGHGVHLTNAKDCTVNNNTITGKNYSSKDSNKDSYDGIFLSTGSNNVEVANNKIKNMARNGIFVQLDSRASTIKKNNIQGCGRSGINFYSKSGTTGAITENTIKKCKGGGILVSTKSKTGDITKNILTGNSGGSGINVYKSSTVGKIADNDICDTGTSKSYQPAIKLTTSATSKTISNNRITADANKYASGYGILVFDKSKVKGSITKNEIGSVADTAISITTKASVTKDISYNTIKNSTKSGIFVFSSSKVGGDIKNNKIKKVKITAIYLTGSATVSGEISSNVVGSAGNKGIFVYNKSTVKAIKNNTVTNTKYQAINISSLKNKLEISGNKLSKGKDNVIIIQPNTKKYLITIKNNTIKSNKNRAGVRVISGKVYVADNSISNVSYAVYINKGSAGSVYNNKMGSGVAGQLNLGENKLKQNTKKVTLSSVKSSAKKKATVKWKKVSGAEGYEVQYSTAKDFSKSLKSKSIAGAKTSLTLTGLKSKKTYYVRVCSYKTVNGIKVYSAYSKTKTVKVK
ncbi:MAG: right-handed parallel beta-helix repeat-containing protein [Lachnospiraceae bacterium]|nr:right-handed parallel beta-helix repeat-containing protein [Lachnospiraceae bacterium]